jgi:GT2 family glycosyltransferase
VIPTFNRAASLRRTLEALDAQTVPARVIVVDNGSDDGTAEMLERDHPSVRRVALEANLGFGAAVNRGIAAGDAPAVVLLNNDTVAGPRFLELALAAQRESGAEMVATCLRSPEGWIESLGVEVDRSLVAFDVWYREPYERLESARPPEPLAPSGGAALYLRSALEAVAGFDERMFAYLEDVELGIRMRLAGMRCAMAPAAYAWHEHSATLGSGAAAKNRLMGRSRGYLVWKHGAGLVRGARARGLLIDGLTYTGQALIDRNLGAVRGRREIGRELAGAARPPANPRVAGLAAERPVSEALAMRLSRRRR